ncbi:hypothetical protein EU527_04850 [Candidatus Thorarchaeota archaeon]|nr:MAG: hypothetical protein EU527_04850 [Candidatus Thorarchaeota archaeon]
MHCKQISEIVTPCLLIHKNRLMKNIERMAQKAKQNRVALCPHIKTHKCIEIAELQREHGATGLTVSTLDEASIFADAGFNHITYAVPISSNKIDTALDIAYRIELKLLVDNHQAIETLDERSKEHGSISDVLLKVDCGYHRCGVDPDSYSAIKLVKKIVESNHLRFRGILTHAGHSYDAKTIEQVKKIAHQEQQVMVNFATKLENENESFKPEIVSIGSTPTISLTDKIMEGITEIRPGNYVFYDYSQVKLQSCKIEDCALTILTRVIGKYEHHLVIDAGATSLSKDLGPFVHEDEKEYGKIYANYENDSFESSLRIDSISQEHGKVRATSPSIFEKIEFNGMLRILPNHSCLTANLHDAYYIVDDSKIIDQWKIRRDRPIISACW